MKKKLIPLLLAIISISLLYPNIPAKAKSIELSKSELLSILSDNESDYTFFVDNNEVSPDILLDIDIDNYKYELDIESKEINLTDMKAIANRGNKIIYISTSAVIIVSVILLMIMNFSNAEFSKKKL